MASILITGYGESKGRDALIKEARQGENVAE